MSSADRALGALWGLAIGDALGMPTQMLPRSRARHLLGAEPRFLPGPADNPISRGMPAGSITDDTEQALIIARLLIEGKGSIDAHRMADELLAWERRMSERGSLDLLGPSTKRALAAVAAGADPLTTGSGGDTDGAAMRVTPVGIATPPKPLQRLVDAVVAAGQVTHDTNAAHAGAAAIAAVVSSGVSGLDFESALVPALTAAELAGQRGHRVVGADLGARIRRAVALASEQSGDAEAALDAISAAVGTSSATTEAVPAAFAVTVLAPRDAWRACGLAARLGGDTDTIAALVGAMVGACTGLAALPAAAVATVSQVNGLDLEPVARRLLELRDRAEGAAR